jgi:hypothetical protein
VLAVFDEPSLKEAHFFGLLPKTDKHSNVDGLRLANG